MGLLESLGQVVDIWNRGAMGNKEGSFSGFA